MKTQGIYAITHIASGRVYVGSAIRIAKRWRNHRHELDRGIHHTRRLQAAWIKFGAKAFTFSVLEVVPHKADLLIREQWWIDELNTVYADAGFNSCPVGGSRLGTKHSDETRAKLRAAWQTRPKAAVIAMGLSSRGRVLTPEHVEKMRAAALKMSHETKARITAATMGHSVSQATRAKLSKANKGQVISAAQRAMISAFHKGKVLSPETRAKMSTSRMGHAVSPETRAKLSAANTGWKHSPEVRAKMSAIRRAALAAQSRSQHQGQAVLLLADVPHLPRREHASQEVQAYPKSAMPSNGR